MPQRESLYHQYPDYRVELERSPDHIRALLAGTTLADSHRTLIVRETKLEPVVYFPREDVHLELAERSDHQSFCPFKGEASYWTFRCSEAESENVAWSYEDPFEEIAGLRDYIAFYSDRVELVRQS